MGYEDGPDTVANAVVWAFRGVEQLRIAHEPSDALLSDQFGDALAAEEVQYVIEHVLISMHRRVTPDEVGACWEGYRRIRMQQVLGQEAAAAKAAERRKT